MLMIFVDGWGFGKKDAAINPLFLAQMKTLRSWFDGKLPSLKHRYLEGKNSSIKPLDATGGVVGLPQSGTGQTTIFTGINAPAMLQRHFGPYANSALKPVIQEYNIFKRLLDHKKKVCFANAYPRQFFEYIQSGKTRLSVTTLCCQMAGVKIRGENELRNNSGISADLTRERWPSLGHEDIPVISPFDAGRQLGLLSQRYDFTLFEYFYTDHAGHQKNPEEAAMVLEKFDELLHGISDAISLRSNLLLITSDHGNIEDLSTKSHTRNPVPLVLVGKHHQRLAARIKKLEHITPVLVEQIIHQH